MLSDVETAARALGHRRRVATLSSLSGTHGLSLRKEAVCIVRERRRTYRPNRADPRGGQQRFEVRPWSRGKKNRQIRTWFQEPLVVQELTDRHSNRATRARSLCLDEVVPRPVEDVGEDGTRLAPRDDAESFNARERTTSLTAGRDRPRLVGRVVGRERNVLFSAGRWLIFRSWPRPRRRRPCLVASD